MKGSLFGPRFKMRKFHDFKRFECTFPLFPDEEALLDQVCYAIEGEKIVGSFGENGIWSSGTWGRSIIGDARSEKTQTQMNLSINTANPFVHLPQVFWKKNCQIFQLDTPSPYMLLVAPVKEEIRAPQSRKIKNHGRSTYSRE